MHMHIYIYMHFHTNTNMNTDTDTIKKTNLFVTCIRIKNNLLFLPLCHILFLTGLFYGL